MHQWGIIIANQHSFYDHHAIMESGKVDQPKEIKIVERIPYSNRTYDFSYGYNGQAFYDERKMSFIFHLHDNNKPLLIDEVSRFCNWLRGEKGKKPVIFTKIPDYYFNAEILDILIDYPMPILAKITATFTAYPFRIPLDPNSDLTEVI